MNLNTDYFPGSHFLVARFKANGYLDGTFGNSGKRISDLRGIVFQKATVTAAECQLDVSMLKAGVYNLDNIENKVRTSRKFIKQ